jgi:hypothetical protein
MSGLDEFAPYRKKYGCFTVLNISHLNQNYGPYRKKVVKIFNYPILPGHTRDLLAIPGVSEADIRASLLKGEIRHKILAQDIIVVCSDIDLLQFNNDQKQFLMQAGITNGLEIKIQPGNLSYAWREKIPLIGLRNGINRIFFTPDKFINGPYNGNIFNISIEHNGKALYEGIDFNIKESGGLGTGYDTIEMFSLTPNSHSLLFATYAIKI